MKSSGSIHLERRERGVITPIHINTVAERVGSCDLVIARRGVVVERSAWPGLVRGTYDGVSGGTLSCLYGDIDNTSTKDRLQALEKLAVSMHGYVIQARTAAAARAEQRAIDVKARVLGARSEGVEDARSPGTPRSLEDATDNCRQSKFAFMD